MAKKKQKKHTPVSLNKNYLIGGGFLFFGILTAFGNSSSQLGSLLAPVLVNLFGDYFLWIVAPICITLGVFLLISKIYWNSLRLVGLLLFFISVCSLLSAFGVLNAGFFSTNTMFVAWFGKVPAFFAETVLFLLSLPLSLGLSYKKVIHHAKNTLPTVADIKDNFKETFVADEIIPKKIKTSENHTDKMKELELQIKELEKMRSPKKEEIKTVKVEPKIAERKEEIKTVPVITKTDAVGKFAETGEKEETKTLPQPDFTKWDFPSTAILDAAKKTSGIDLNEVEQKALQIKKALLQFKIDVEMVEQKVGPTVIQYRLKPAEGIKLNRIENLKKDLTLALKAKSVRIQAPIPGIGLVGVEVPNDNRSTITIREVLESSAFTASKSNLALAVGKDINGNYVVGDLAKMPHLLIAGQTGSGKSVGMNGFLVSLLYKNSPSTLRLIMVDPKRVELGIYNGIPHLLTPVINDADKALNALKWSVTEMLRRYDILQQVRCRNLAEFNEKANKKDKLPHIVIVIDELADLMMSGNKKEVETTIARIAQMARAVGMHLIIATQRPSVDVITGLIKANVPSRIAFTVASLVDSRTILDRSGAEDLLGYGDMLYLPSGAMESERIQGVLVTTEEVEAVVNHIRRTIDPEMLESLYDASIVEGEKGNYEGSIAGQDSDEDPKIIEQAIQVVRAEGKASTSLLQRRLKL